MFKILLSLLAIAHAQVAANVDFLHIRPSEPYTVISRQAGINIRTSKVADLTSEVNAESLYKMRVQFDSNAFEAGDRVIVINSGGGETTAGTEMVKLIEQDRANGVRVVCVVDNNAHSMAFNLLTHCDVRLATKKSTMVVHKVRAFFMFTIMTAKQLRKAANDIDKTDEPFRQANAKAMHLSLKDYDKFADKETRWNAQTLIDIGYLHGLVDEN